MKIQFGSGSHNLEGWINTDFPAVDVTKPLNYSNNSIEFIFHEHLIEHLDEVDGFNFLQECHRILKPGGVMRISCPGIDDFLKIYHNWETQKESFKKIHVNKARFFNDVTLGEAVNYVGKKFNHDGSISTINNSNGWHKYLYDKDDFIEKLTKIGFNKIVFCKKHESDHLELRKLERRFGWGIFLEFPEDTDITLEATK